MISQHLGTWHIKRSVEGRLPGAGAGATPFPLPHGYHATDPGDPGHVAPPTPDTAGPPIPRDGPDPAVTGHPPAEPPLSVTTWRSSADVLRVEVAGEIDMATSPRLRKELWEAIMAGGPRSAVRVDLEGVYVVDAGGVAVLVDAHRAAREYGISFSLERPRGVVLRVLEILGLTDQLPVVPATAAV